MKTMKVVHWALLTACPLVVGLEPQAAGFGAAERSSVLGALDQRATHFGDLSRQVWEWAEVGYKETNSSRLLASELRSAGFTVQENIGGMPTAFVASWGAGKPVIGLLGEYDALPGLSQADVPEKKPRVPGGSGQGCGHNLLGVASAAAAIVAKEFLSDHKLPGTVRYYGTPAEEGGDGKVYMARAGVFDDCDAVLSWHPDDQNRAELRSTLAMLGAKFRFHGRAAHAAMAPDKGRSALDGLMLTCQAVEMLREHVPSSARIHYIITQGGNAPNIVPEFAELYLYARHPEMLVLDGIWARVGKCAEAGALATDTRLEVEFISSDFNVLPNDALTRLLDRNLRQVGGVRYSEAERTFAETIRKTIATEHDRPLGSQEQIQTPEEGVTPGSTDVGDVSWLVPTGALGTATMVPGVPLHSWQATACAGSSIGRKGMMVAAKTLALTALDLLTDPKEIAAARASFDQRRAGREYRARIPADHKPPLNYRDR
jgi:aminobenzoyl-glutamate utilization protein B